MYITNPEKIKNKYVCEKKVADYLISECKIPILSIDGNNYYFADTKKVRDAVENMPFLKRYFGKIF